MTESNRQEKLDSWTPEKLAHVVASLSDEELGRVIMRASWLRDQDTESKQPEASGVMYMPDKLARYGIHVAIYDGPEFSSACIFNTRNGKEYDLKREMENVGEFVRRVYTEATRIAKECYAELKAKGVKVWWVSSNPYDQVVTSEPCMNNDVPFVLADDHRRAVGETPDDELEVLRRWTAKIIDAGSREDGTMLEHLHDRLFDANAAFKAAREAK